MKTKRNITGFISLLITIAILSIVSGCTTTSGELPDFKIRKIDHSEVNVTQFIKGKISLLVHFDADCKGCQDETQMIVDHIDELGDVNKFSARMKYKLNQTPLNRMI